MNHVTKVMSVSIITNISLTILKILFGFISKSSALLADGVHSLSDLLTDFFAIFGNIMAKKPADTKHPYGHGKIEYLTSIGISIIILMLGFSMIYNISKSSVSISSLIVIIISMITILSKYILSKYVIKKGKLYDNNILIASGNESKADVISSLVVLISGILGMFKDYIGILKYTDKIAGIIVGILIIKTGFQILKENISIVIGEQEIDEIELDKIRNIIKQNKEIKTIDKLIVLKFGYCYKVSLEVSMNKDLTLLKCHDIIDSIEGKIKHSIPKVEYITTHVNPYMLVDNDVQS